MIVLFTFVIITVASYLYLHLDIFLNEQSKITLENANRVRLDFDLYYFYV
jgi:hypothetical protein